MKIGILETGAPPGPLYDQFGSYPSMFQRLLTDAGVAATTEVFDVQAGKYPVSPEAFDAYLVTGSPAGVYEPLPWIAPMMDFLRASRGRAKLVGVCFGHQAMAEAFGGKVIKSPKGWGLGQQRYEMREQRPWMDSTAPVSIPASHQDQVVELPAGTQVLGGNDFNPYGMLEYVGGDAISMQPHPEFDPAYAAALVERRRGAVLGDVEADAAIASLNGPDDRARVGGWIRRFLDG